jgi:iron complex transport system substrate-binding protein
VRHRPSTPRLAGLLALVLLVAAPGPASASPPKRIVALTPFTANTLAALGVKPVGVGETLGGDDRLSPKLRGVKRLPLSHPNGPNMEQLALLNPQLVLSAPAWKKGESVMRQLKMRVVESDPQSVAAVGVETKRIGALVGKAALAKRFAAKQLAHVKASKKAVKRHPSVLLILGVGRTPYAFLKNSWGGDLVRQSGGRLITKGLTGSGGFARISNEYVVQQDPDVIIAVPHGDAADIPKLAAYLKTNPAWATTRAVEAGHLYVSDDNTLLQASTDAAQRMKIVQTTFLKNR